MPIFRGILTEMLNTTVLGQIKEWNNLPLQLIHEELQAIWIMLSKALGSAKRSSEMH